MSPAVRKMIELMAPTIHSSVPVPSIPNSVGNDRLAPFEPVWSQPVLISADVVCAGEEQAQEPEG